MGADEDLVINAVETSSDGGLVITYGRLPRDIRKNGLMWQHSVQVPGGSDYDEELEAVREALRALLLDVLDDEDRAEPIEMEQEEEEENDDE